jgi:hypothetical protein
MRFDYLGRGLSAIDRRKNCILLRSKDAGATTVAAVASTGAALHTAFSENPLDDSRVALDITEGAGGPGITDTTWTAAGPGVVFFIALSIRLEIFLRCYASRSRQGLKQILSNLADALYLLSHSKSADPCHAGRSTGFSKLYANRMKSTIKKTFDRAQV